MLTDLEWGCGGDCSPKLFACIDRLRRANTPEAKDDAVQALVTFGPQGHPAVIAAMLRETDPATLTGWCDRLPDQYHTIARCHSNAVIALVP